MSDSEKVEKKSQKPVERVTIDEALKEKLAILTTQANESLQGIATVTKSDVVNMIIEEHAEVLSAKEIEYLKAAHIDQVKLALWLANEIKGARKAGEVVTLKELLERCESVLAPKQTRRLAERTRKSKGEVSGLNTSDVPVVISPDDELAP